MMSERRTTLAVTLVRAMRTSTSRHAAQGGGVRGGGAAGGTNADVNNW